MRNKRLQKSITTHLYQTRRKQRSMKDNRFEVAKTLSSENSYISIEGLRVSRISNLPVPAAHKVCKLLS